MAGRYVCIAVRSVPDHIADYPQCTFESLGKNGIIFPDPSPLSGGQLCWPPDFLIYGEGVMW